MSIKFIFQVLKSLINIKSSRLAFWRLILATKISYIKRNRGNFGLIFCNFFFNKISAIEGLLGKFLWSKGTKTSECIGQKPHIFPRDHMPKSILTFCNMETVAAMTCLSKSPLQTSMTFRLCIFVRVRPAADHTPFSETGAHHPLKIGSDFVSPAARPGTASSAP